MGKSTKIIDSDWKSWFMLEKEHYAISRTLYCIVLATNVFALLFVWFHTHRVLPTVLLIILAFYIIIQIIAYHVRYNDVSKIFNGYDTLDTMTLEVKKKNGKEINRDYCYIYMTACGVKVEVGQRYRVKYLKKTMGKYIVEWHTLPSVSSESTKSDSNTAAKTESKSSSKDKKVNRKVTDADIEAVKAELKADRDEKTLDEQVNETLAHLKDK